MDVTLSCLSHSSLGNSSRQIVSLLSDLVKSILGSGSVKSTTYPNSFVVKRFSVPSNESSDADDRYKSSCKVVSVLGKSAGLVLEVVGLGMYVYGDFPGTILNFGLVVLLIGVASKGGVHFGTTLAISLGVAS